jgi:hypothetical protein
MDVCRQMFLVPMNDGMCAFAVLTQPARCRVSLLLLQAKRGLHSNKEVQVPRVNDVSTPGNGQRAKQYLPFLQRAGKLFGTVEMCSSGECDRNVRGSFAQETGVPL